VEPSEIVRQVLHDLRVNSIERAPVTVKDLAVCQADPALLKQVYVNLISNALKYTRCSKPPLIEIGCHNDNGTPVYYVRDNGVGFDMKYADKLFGVFQRLHRAEEYEGTGVGLAVVQRVIQRHGGRIWAEAAVNKGATFFFTLGGSNHDANH
jgi:light-regulated signal transduction histidine kinase (bacteriophytochrome)